MKKLVKVFSFVVAIAMLATLVLPANVLVNAAKGTAISHNFFSLKIDDTDVVSNGVSGGAAIKTIGTGATVATAEAGFKYIQNTKTSTNFFKVDYNSYYMKFYNNYENSQTNDLSFTYELTICMDDMPASTQTDWSSVAGYIESGGFGFGVSGKEGAEGNIVISKGGYWKSGSATYLTMPFSMKANNWYHIVLVYDDAAKAAYGYVNGVQIGSVDVPNLFLSYNWSNGGSIAAGHNGSTSVPFGNKIATYGFSTVAMTAAQVSAAYDAECAKGIFATPNPDYFSLSISETDVISNGVTGGSAIKTIGTGATVGTDEAGNKYLANTKGSTNFNKIDFNNYYLKFYHNYESGKSNDLTFTYELVISMDELPAATQTDWSSVAGYLESGGFGFGVSGKKGAEGNIIISKGGYWKNGSATYLTMPFAMEADTVYHIVLVYNHAAKKAFGYVNGELVGSVDVPNLFLSYNWSNGGSIAAGHNGSTSVPYDNKVYACNFYTSALTGSQVTTKAIEFAKKGLFEAPEADYFSLAISEANAISNGVTGGSAIKTIGTGSAVGTDTTSEHKYLDIAKNAANFNKIDFNNWYLKFYHNHKSGQSNDLSFTYELMVNVPELPAATQQGYTTVAGYAESGGFMFSVSGKEGEEGLLSISDGGYWGDQGASAKYSNFAFPMEADTWYHLILTYNWNTKVASAYVDGELIGTATIDDLFLSYNWNNGGTIGAGHNGSTAAPIGVKVGNCNFYTTSVSPVEAYQMNANMAEEWAPVPPPITPPTGDTAVFTGAVTAVLMVAALGALVILRKKAEGRA